MRNVCTGMLAGGLMLPLSVGAVNEPINIQVTISNPQPGCNVTVLGGGVGAEIRKNCRDLTGSEMNNLTVRLPYRLAVTEMLKPE